MKECPDIGRIIDEETASRLNEMSRADYEFPPKAAAWNWWAIVASVVVSVILIGLCMMGVIK